ncbi:MAG: nucleotidyltransferase family protein [Planctomycetota bacterium]
MAAFEERMREGGAAAVAEASRFFMKKDPVHDALRAIARRLREEEIPYAVAGGMALVAHGYLRTTEDVDVVVTAEGLAAVHERLKGLGYRAAFKGSRHLRDTEGGVRIEFLVSGEFPGDGKKKPVAFPDPSKASVEIDRIRYVSLATLVEMKLASGMTNPGRLKDLADVQEMIRILGLKAAFARKLDPYVRATFEKLRKDAAAGVR